MDKAIRLFPYIILIFHAVGIVLFIQLAKAPDISYLNILLSALLVLAASQRDVKSLMVFAIIFICGFTIELIGVQTGLLFGSYVYMDTMGPMIYGTPLIIGATWYAVVAGASSIVQKLPISILAKSLTAGLLTVIMDLLIEQVAINYGLWNWDGGSVPLYNYVCWFIFGTIFSFIYLKTIVNHNSIARYLYGIWFLFFAILTIVK